MGDLPSYDEVLAFCEYGLEIRDEGVEDVFCVIASGFCGECGVALFQPALVYGRRERRRFRRERVVQSAIGFDLGEEVKAGGLYKAR